MNAHLKSTKIVLHNVLCLWNFRLRISSLINCTSVFPPLGLWWNASISSCRTAVNVSSTLRSQNGVLRRQVDRARSSNIQLTREVEKRWTSFSSLPGKPWRQLTSDDSLQETDSGNPSSHKTITIRTLPRRVQLVYNTTDNLSDENKYLDRGFSKNNYQNKRNHNSDDYSDYTVNNGHVWEHLAYPTTLYYPHRPQTHHHTRPVTNKRQTQRGTARGTDRERFLRSIAPTATSLHRRDWQKPHNKTDRTQASDKERWSHHWLTNHTFDRDSA